MAYLNNSDNKKADFDWDEINVGDFNLDHSENFFAAAFSAPAPNNLGDAIDLSHKLDNLNNTSQLKASLDWNVGRADAYIMEHSETIYASTANKENIRGPLNWNNEPAHEIKQEVKRELQFNDIKIQEPRACLQSVEMAGEQQEYAPLESEFQLQLNLTPVLPRMEEFHCKVELDDNDDGYQPRKLNPPEPSPVSVQSQSPCQLELQDTNSVKNEPLDYKVKLRLGWTPQAEKPGDGHAAAGAVKAPRAYECKEVYQAKREMALRQREEEERKAREFHSKPMPNFKALHKRLANTIVIHRITVPITPETVKHSYADMERRKRREQEAKMSQQQQENGEMMRRAMHEAKPFQLRADQRVRERREYNHVVQCHQEEKKKQQDEQRKQRELEETKELRRMMEFKARPNPFK